MDELQIIARTCMDSTEPVDRRLAAASEFVNIEAAVAGYRRRIRLEASRMTVTVAINGSSIQRSFHPDVLETVKLLNILDRKSF